MNENERDLLKRLAPKPVPPPPEGLLRRLKEEIPARLPANVRPFRRRLSAQALRIAAMLFVAGGALFVISRGIRHGDLEPAVPSAKPAGKPDAVPRRAVETPPAPVPAPETRADKDQEADATRAKPRGSGSGFAPAMPSEKKALQTQAAAPPPAPAPSRDANEPAFADEGRLAQSAPAMAPEIASAPARPAPVAKAESAAVPRMRQGAAANREGYLAAPIHVEPTRGSLLAQALGHRVPAVAAREGERVLVLLSVGGETADLSGAGQVLSAAALPDGGLVVLLETREGARISLRSGDEVVSAGAPLASSPDVHLAYLAYTLERARASGDAAVRSRVSREAEGLRAADPRAAVLRDLARVP